MVDLSTRLLGLPADTRALIVTCDDVGIHDGATEGIVEALDAGVATSCSLMVPPPASAAAIAVLQPRPDIDVGVHLTLTSDFPTQPWSACAPPGRVPSMVDAHGRFGAQSTIPELLRRAVLEEVRLELRLQIETVLGAGLTPSHLDWHCIADGGRPDILDATVALAREYGLAARVWLDPGRSELRAAGLPVVDHPFLDSFAVPVEGKQEALLARLHHLPCGLSEWAVHPSTSAPGVPELDPGLPVRGTDLDFLVSPRAREVIDREGIVLLDYRDLERAWSSP